MSLARLAERLRAGELSPREAVADSLARIERPDGALNAFLTRARRGGPRRGAELERLPERGPLYGVPIAVKDVIDVAGTPTTAALEILADNVPAADATSVARLRAGRRRHRRQAEHARVRVRGDDHEPAFRPRAQPVGPRADLRRLERRQRRGGGGDLVPGTLGTDTGGSIRIPACLCGVTGLRPSTGRVSTAGVVPVVVDVRHGRPAGAAAPRTARCCSRRSAGHDPADPGTARAPVPRYAEELGDSIAGSASASSRTSLDERAGRSAGRRRGRERVDELADARAPGSSRADAAFERRRRSCSS